MINQAPSSHARLGWNHHFKSMIQSGEIAKIGVYAYSVLTVIKSYADFKTGYATVSQQRIAELLGISLKQVQRASKTLEQHKYLVRQGKKRRCYAYQVQERVFITTQEGVPQAAASWPYIPSQAKSAVQEVKQFISSGKIDACNSIHIENLQININDNSTNIIASVKNLDHLPLSIREKLEKILANASRRTYPQD